MIITPGRINFQAVLLNDCIRWAYGLADYQIVASFLTSIQRSTVEHRGGGLRDLLNDT